MSKPLLDYPRPALTVDLLIFSQYQNQLSLFLIQRQEPPFQGQWSLPGSFVKVNDDIQGGESLDDTADRILREKTNLSPQYVHREQLYTFSKPNRDPRLRVVSVAYYALIPQDKLHPIQDSCIQWYPIRDFLRNPLNLAFDHQDIIQYAIQRLSGKSEYTPVLLNLLPSTFTFADLRQLYELLSGTQLDPSNFRRKCKRWVGEGLIIPLEGQFRSTGSRPAQLYRTKVLPVDPLTN